jgi:hypothetical protein
MPTDSSRFGRWRVLGHSVGACQLSFTDKKRDTDLPIALLSIATAMRFVAPSALNEPPRKRERGEGGQKEKASRLSDCDPPMFLYQ